MRILSAAHYFIREGEDSNERLRFILVLLFTFSLPFNLFYSSLIFITLAVLTLFDLKKVNLKRVPGRFWLFQAVYFFALSGYFYSLNKHAAAFLLERQLTIFLFPLLLPVAIRITSEKLRMVLDVLAVSCVVTVFYLMLSMIFMIRELHVPVLKTVMSGVFFNHRFSEPIGIHAGYLSLYFSLSIIHIASLINREASWETKVMQYVCLAILFTGLMFLATRNSIITTLLILLVVFPLFSVRKKLRYILIVLACMVLAFLLVEHVPYLKERFSVELVSDIKPLDNGKFLNYSATEPRIERWKCAMELIKRSPLIGYGSGDEIDMLKTEYARKGFFISYIESFNAHNQYLSIWLKHGIIGLLLFLALFYYYCRLAVKNKDFVYFAFLLLLLFGFYTENILDANKGIVFFALFNTLFGYVALNKKGTDAAATEQFRGTDRLN